MVSVVEQNVVEISAVIMLVVFYRGLLRNEHDAPRGNYVKT